MKFKGALPPKCDVCKKEFNQIRDLRTHKLRYHNITMKMRTYERTKCDICHKKIRGNRSLKRHKKVAHGIMKKILPNPQDLKCEKELTDEEKNAMQGMGLFKLFLSQPGVFIWVLFYKTKYEFFICLLSLFIVFSIIFSKFYSVS